MRVPTDEGAELLAKLRRLHAEGRYALLPPLIEAVRTNSASAGAASELVDGFYGGVTVPRVHRYLVGELQGARPRPLVRVRRREVEFFGHVFGERDLGGAGWPILRALAGRANAVVTRPELLRTAKLGCAEQDLPPHVARLRKRLKPVIDAYYDGLRLNAPEAAAASFIGAVRAGDPRGRTTPPAGTGGSGDSSGYSLAVAPELVSVDAGQA
jgi:hypothetical protein